MSGVFLKVLNMSITASWLIAAVILLRLLLKKAPKWVNCLLWAVVAVRLICPFSIESVLSLVPTDEPVPMNIVMAPRPTVETGVPVIDSAINPVLSESMAPQVGDSVNPLQVVTFVATIVWIVGVAVLLAYALISWLRLRRKVDASIEIKKGVRAGDDVDSPFILGVFKPIVYVPATMGGETLESVLRHESAHLARKDHWWKPLGFLLLTVYWFNPLCWVAYILLCRDIELACDEKVIRDMDAPDKAAYSQALLDCSVNRARVAACPLAFGEAGVKERVKSVLNYKKPAFWVIVCAVVACVVVAVCFLTKAKSEEPDLSFLNYKNAVSIAADYTDIEAVYHDSSSSRIMVADGTEVAGYLDTAEWEKCKAPSGGLPSENSVQFEIADEYFITVYEKPQRAEVRFEDEVRYYKTGASDYEAAKALLHEEASVEKETFMAKVVQIYDASIVVSNIDPDVKSTDIIDIPRSSLEDTYTPEVGDIVKITYNGVRYLSDPAQLGEIYEVKHVPAFITESGGNIYVWEKEGFGGAFTITLYNDGTFQYYVGLFSSHIGSGTWFKDDSVLTLIEDAAFTGYDATFTFEAQEDRLIYKQNKSAPFGGVTVEDGDKFLLISGSSELAVPEPEKENDTDSETDTDWLIQSTNYKLPEDFKEILINTCHFDITHDGKPDTIRVLSVEFKESESVDFDNSQFMGRVKVYDGDVAEGDNKTEPIWVKEFGVPHTGNGQVFATTVDSEDYLVVTSLYEGQGGTDYIYSVFCLEEGTIQVIETGKESFESEHVPDLTDFFEGLYSWINADSSMLLGTDIDTYPSVFCSQGGSIVNPDEYYSRKGSRRYIK
ncbi:MAG: hypothetical protein IKR39_01520 [Lachnospiraceae bacterium]|nr:hypothetical protein [Lachnospiraceae bacterium]